VCRAGRQEEHGLGTCIDFGEVRMEVFWVFGGMTFDVPLLWDGCTVLRTARMIQYGYRYVELPYV